jgi:hypothetical protein
MTPETPASLKARLLDALETLVEHICDEECAATGCRYYREADKLVKEAKSAIGDAAASSLEARLRALARFTGVGVGEMCKRGIADLWLRWSDVESALVTKTPAPGWRPIESAPKDGTPILVAFKNKGVFQVFWSEEPFGPGIGAWCVTDCKYEDRPLRGYSEGAELGWMPLPTPPSSEPSEEK